MTLTALAAPAACQAVQLEVEVSAVPSNKPDHVPAPAGAPLLTSLLMVCGFRQPQACSECCHSVLKCLLGCQACAASLTALVACHSTCQTDRSYVQL